MQRDHFGDEEGEAADAHSETRRGDREREAEALVEPALRQAHEGGIARQIAHCHGQGHERHKGRIGVGQRQGGVAEAAERGPDRDDPPRYKPVYQIAGDRQDEGVEEGGHRQDRRELVRDHSNSAVTGLVKSPSGCMRIAGVATLIPMKQPSNTRQRVISDAATFARTAPF